MKPVEEENAHLRMFRRKYSRDRLFLYLIPIIIGLGGIVLSMQLQDLYVRIIVLMLSVSIPLFAGGNVLARYRTRRVERFFLGSGLFMLIFGASLSMSGFGSGAAFDIATWVQGDNLTRILGVLSLMLGLFAILFTVGRTNEDIEEVGERFRHLAEHMSEGVILSDAHGNVILVNDQFLEMTNQRPEDVVGFNTKKLALSFGLNPVVENLEKRKRGEASEYTLMLTVGNEQRHFVVNGKPIMDSRGKMTATLATIRDDTEQHQLRKRVERYATSLEHLVEEQTQRLSESEERLRQLLVTMSEGFVTICDANRVRFVNERMKQILGRPEEEIVAHELSEFLDTPGRIRLLNMLARDPRPGGEPMRQEMQFITRPGRTISAMVAVSRMRDAAPDGPQFSVVVTDISELKAMEVQLRERAEELEQLNEELRLHDRAKDSFLSNVSHELRTPLSTVNGYVEMLASGSLGELTPEQRRVSGVMKRNLDRLASLINEIIEFSRMEIRGMELSITLFDVEDLVNEAAASAHPGASDKSINICVEVPEPLGVAWGDPRRIQQVLAILLHNAVKFTGQGGDIVIGARREENGEIVLSVKDNGIGIDPAYHEQVFAKFFQVDSSKTRRFEGAGIGLSIAKGIAESHGGSLSLESAPGQGSKFTIHLPGAAFNSRIGHFPEEVSGRPFAVLDESGTMAGLIKGLLEPQGCTIHRTDAANHLMRLLERETVDLVIINADAADIAGLGTERMLMQHPAHASIPRLILTQETTATVPELAEASERSIVLGKPFSGRDLLGAISGALRGEMQAHDTPNESLPEHVLVVDADPELLAFVEMALSVRNIPCIVADTPAQAVRLASQVPVRAILVDADMPGVTIEEYLIPLREAPQTKGAPIYFLTGVENGYHAHAGLSGVLRKPFTAGQLAALLSNEEEHVRG